MESVGTAAAEQGFRNIVIVSGDDPYAYWGTERSQNRMFEPRSEVVCE